MSEDEEPQLHYADFTEDGEITGAGIQDWDDLPPDVMESIKRDLRTGVTFRMTRRRWWHRSPRRILHTDQVRWTPSGEEENPLGRAIIKQGQRRRVSGLVLDGHKYWVIRRNTKT